MNLLEDYLKYLNMDLRPMAKEWNGPNLPVEGDDRPNWIRQCTTMLEHPKMKINCLRRLRDQAAMNPYYQHRIDRYIDEITDTYEPTDYPGTIPGNEFEETGVGEDTPVGALKEALSAKEIAKMTKALKRKKMLLKRKKASKEKTMELMLKRYSGK